MTKNRCVFVTVEWAFVSLEGAGPRRLKILCLFCYSSSYDHLVAFMSMLFSHTLLCVGVDDRFRSTSAMMMMMNRRSVTGTGPMRWNTLKGVRWVSAIPWPETASARSVTQEIRTAAAFLETYPAVCPFKATFRLFHIYLSSLCHLVLK